MLLDTCAALHDRLLDLWDAPAVSRRISLALALIFLSALAAMALNLLGLLPRPLALLIPPDPFFAIRLAFSLILAVEVLELAFAIADSLSRAVGKQMEIMALLLLRESFTDISRLTGHLSEAVDWLLILQVAATAVAGLLLFIFRSLFARWHKSFIANDNLLTYINAKKAVSLLLLACFAVAGGLDLHGVLVQGHPSSFFQIFYTFLIFTDILLVLLSQYFMPCFQAVFRNSGYAVGTLLMRIALGTPHHVGAAVCIFAGLYLLAMTWATSHFSPPAKRERA